MAIRNAGALVRRFNYLGSMDKQQVVRKVATSAFIYIVIFFQTGCRDWANDSP
jgi:hypothetical protein